MNLNEILKKFLDDDSKVEEVLKEMKLNNIHTSNEENIDIRYGKLKTDFELKNKEYEEASSLIAQLKNGNKGNEELQKRIDEYEKQVIPTLQEEMNNLKVESALNLALTSSNVTDIKYIAYLIKEQEKELKLDENGNIKGIEDTIKSFKTSHPTFFKENIKKEIEVKELGKGKTEEPEPTNLYEALDMKYNKTNE